MDGRGASRPTRCKRTVACAQLSACAAHRRPPKCRVKWWRPGRVPLQALAATLHNDPTLTCNGALRPGTPGGRYGHNQSPLTFGGGVQVRPLPKPRCAPTSAPPRTGESAPQSAAVVATGCDSKRLAPSTRPLNKLKQCALQAETRSLTQARNSLNFRSTKKPLPFGASSSIWSPGLVKSMREEGSPARMVSLCSLLFAGRGAGPSRRSVGFSCATTTETWAHWPTLGATMSDAIRERTSLGRRKRSNEVASAAAAKAARRVFSAI